MTTIDATRLTKMFTAIANAIAADKERLCVLDGAVGDADHGIAMELGFSAARDAVTALDPAATEPTALLNIAAKSFLNAVGASSGPLYATAFMRGAAAVKGKPTLDEADMVAAFQAMVKGIEDRGKAVVGEKTMIDAWAPAAHAAGAAFAAGNDLAVWRRLWMRRATVQRQRGTWLPPKAARPALASALSAISTPVRPQPLR